MSSDQHCLCNFCNSQVKNIEERLGFFNVECPICGKYIVPHNLMNSNIFYNKISSYLVHNSSKSIPALFMKKADMDILNDLFPNSKYKLVTNDDVEAFYPTTFSERINRILLWFANRSSYYGEYIDLNETILKSICFIGGTSIILVLSIASWIMKFLSFNKLVILHIGKIQYTIVMIFSLKLGLFSTYK